MKQRTRNILRAAEAALDGYGYDTLKDHGQREWYLTLLRNTDKWCDINEPLAGSLCLLLCFCAAMSESGDL